MAAVAEGAGEEAGREALVFHYICTPIDEELILIQNLILCDSAEQKVPSLAILGWISRGELQPRVRGLFSTAWGHFRLWSLLWCISQVFLHSRKVKLRLVCALVCATHTLLSRIANQNLHVCGIVLAQTQLLVIPGRFAGKLISFTQHLATWSVCQLTWHMHKHSHRKQRGLVPPLKIASGYRDRLITVHNNNIPVSDTCLNQGGNIWFRAAENKADDNDTFQSHNTNNNNNKNKWKQQ